MFEKGREPRSLIVDVKSRLNYIFLIRCVSKPLLRSAVVYHRSKSRLGSWPDCVWSRILDWLGPSGLSGFMSGGIRMKVSWYQLLSQRSLISICKVPILTLIKLKAALFLAITKG